ncbi:MAG: hypothetical protein EA401_12365 [Planctomycetota bacterium]|nr:MAG: hypothetical protein EA401_12365 [Planctomycetota bacterium]
MGAEGVSDASMDALLAQVINPSQTICEWEGWQWAQRCGGVARPRWRAQALAAQANGVCVEPSEDDLGSSWQQILVHAGPQRQAFLRACQRSWNALPVGGTLIMSGANRFGVRSSVRRLAKEWQHPIKADLSGQHGRVMSIAKISDTPVKVLPWIDWQGRGEMSLQAPPGVFAAGRIDRGTRVLLQALENIDLTNIFQITDLGCGSGILGLAILQRADQAQLYAADADDLACAACFGNAQANACGGQVRVQWWDSREPLDAPAADLVLCNPPWHEDAMVARDAGARMVEQALVACAAQGQCFFVATRTQPFEGLLRGYSWQEYAQDDGFKVLRVVRGK